MSFDWQTKAAKARLIRDESLPQDAILRDEDLVDLPFNVTAIPRLCGKLSQMEIDITERHDATELLKLLRSRTLPARDVLRAFMKRAAIAQQLTNCVTELLPEAYQTAEACDRYLENHGQPIGPLHGLPVSVKEQFNVAGHRTNAAFVAWVDNLTQEDCELIRTLKSLGAVVFARTMQPQILMHLETTNNIYGTCVSPFDTRLSPGGSSGGEAVLMAMRGTPLGFGGDIGGSIRCPAAYNGIYGFKPTARVISTQGVTSILPGADSIVGSLGPFTQSKRDLDLVLAAYSSASPWTDDPELVVYKFETINLFMARKLRIGILADDGIERPDNRVSRTLEHCIDKLSTDPRLVLIPFRPLDHDKAWNVLQSLYFEGCEDTVHEVVQSSGEPLLPLTQWILRLMQEKDTRGPATMLQQQKAKVMRDRYRKAYSDHWNASEVDVVLSPVGPTTAPAHNTSMYWNYTAVWNLLDYPALSFPASSLLQPSETSTSVGHVASAGDTGGGVLSMPVGLQLIAKRWQDNELLAALSIVEESLKQ